MKKNKILGCMIICCISTVHGMNPMDDQSLAETTGQDGINIGIGINRVELNQIALIDTDGLTSPSNYNNKAGFVLARSGSPITLDILGSNSSPTLNIVADTDGGNGQPFANLGISFANNITGLSISPFSIYLAGKNSLSGVGNSSSVFTNGTLNSDVKELLRVNSNIDINFVAGNAPKMNLQLGNVSQAHMLQFSGAIQSVCNSGCNITVVSDDSGAHFSLALKATDTINGFSLNHFYAGVQPSGLVLGNTGTSSQVDATISNLTFGTAGQSNSAIFNGTQNAAIGTIGAVGASFKDLKIKISGM